ncbi:MAG: Crp/Fnr family transcriptional regulator [Deltaproteobacteria bacterium]|nr:Crp/Fnr family transcriptional regulator [Deltaproteobacteria bacterium]
MFDLNDLRSIVILSPLNDSMLEKLIKITSMQEYEAGRYIFKEGEYAEFLYAVLDGKVGLEVEKSVNKPIQISTIVRGFTFGFSALVDTEEKKYTTSAKALTDTKVFIWKGADLERLFYQDYEMGFLFMKRIAKLIKTRLQIKNVQSLNIYK